MYQDGDGTDSRDKIKKVGWRILNPSEMPGSQSEVWKSLHLKISTPEDNWHMPLKASLTTLYEFDLTHHRPFARSGEELS